jgi:hypothetical protein
MRFLLLGTAPDFLLETRESNFTLQTKADFAGFPLVVRTKHASFLAILVP